MPRAGSPCRARATAWLPRRAWFGLTLVALALAGYLAWPTPTPSPPSLDPSRDLVVFLGDSITSGHGLPLEATFPHRLGETLGIPVRNAGISGDTTAGGLARLARDVLAYRPKLVVVELGANDASRRLPLEATLDNVRMISRRIRNDGSGTLLLHVTIPALGGDRYLDGFRAIARQEGAWLLEDFLSGVVPGLTTDGLHPTAEGHARLADRLTPLLRGILSSD